MGEWVDIFKERMREVSSPLPDNELEVLEKMINRRRMGRRAIWYLGTAATALVLGFLLTNSRDITIQKRELDPNQDNITQSPYLADIFSAEEKENHENKLDMAETIQEDNHQPESIDFKDVTEGDPAPPDSINNNDYEDLVDYGFEQPEIFPPKNNKWTLCFSLSGLSASSGNILFDGIPYLQKDPASYHHYSPLSIGVALQYNISSLLSITSGIDYIYCHSRISYSSTMTNSQNAHYLKVPLRLNAQLFQSQDFSLYMGAGFEASKLLYAKEGGLTLKDHNIYCSASVLAGLRYNVTPGVGINLEPIFSHTFLPDERPVLTALTDHPNLFLIKIGLSLNIN